MQPVRCHPTVIIENIFRFFRQMLPSLIIPIIAATQLDGRILIIAGLVAAAFVLAVIYQALAWRVTWLKVEDEQLVISSGLIWKKKKTIPYDKINTIDLERNIFQRVFGTCRIKVDTGAVTGGNKKEAEVNLVFKMETAQSVRGHLLHLAGQTQIPSFNDSDVSGEQGRATVQTSDGKVYARRSAEGQDAVQPLPRETYKASGADFFLYGLTQSKALAVFGAGFGLLALAGEWLDDQTIEMIGRSAISAWENISRWNILLTIFLAGALFFAIYLAANLVTILYSVVRYYGFSASREGANIHIEYGLITAKSYTLPIHNIHAVVISQNLFRQLLGQASCEVVSIGYGDEKNEIALLFPLLRLRELDLQLARILPEYQQKLDLSLAPSRAAFRFFIWPALILIAYIGICLIFWPPALLALLVLAPWLAGTGWLSYRHAGLAYSDRQVEAQNGGWVKRRFRIRLEAVQSVSSASHPLMERSALQHIRIDYHAPALRSVVRVRYLEDRHLSALRELMD